MPAANGSQKMNNQADWIKLPYLIDYWISITACAGMGEITVSLTVLAWFFWFFFTCSWSACIHHSSMLCTLFTFFINFIISWSWINSWFSLVRRIHVIAHCLLFKQVWWGHFRTIQVKWFICWSGTCVIVAWWLWYSGSERCTIVEITWTAVASNWLIGPAYSMFCHC